MVPDPGLAGEVRRARGGARIRDRDGSRRCRPGQAPRSAALGRPGNRGAVMTQSRSPVPLLDLQAQYQPLRAELLAAIERVCDSQRFILGPEVEALEAELAKAIGSPHAITISSGT